MTVAELAAVGVAAALLGARHSDLDRRVEPSHRPGAE